MAFGMIERLLKRTTNRILLNFLICLYVSSLLTNVAAFNVDTDIPVFKIGQSGSYFGFAVAQHLKGNQPLLLVGAPRAESGQVGTKQAGAIFSCPVNTVTSNSTSTRRLSWCTKEQVEYRIETDPDNPDFVPENPYDKPPSTIVGESVHSQGKNNQLLGSVISSGGKSTSGVLVCAPLIRYRQAANTEGTCYVLDNDLRNSGGALRACMSLSPKSNRHNGYGACMDGFSALYDDQLKVMVTGAPGATAWTGGVFAQNLEGRNTLRWTMGHNKNKDSVQNVMEKHSYLGFSVRAGRFGFWYEGTEGDPYGKITLVSGATRVDERGAAIFMPFNPDFSKDMDGMYLLKDHYKFTGTTLASAFGYAIEVLKLNGGDFDDLLVGAPYHYELEDKGTKIYGGAVFVYFSKGQKQDKNSNDKVFEEPIKLLGPAYSQFGLSLAKLGDINKDGFDDFAVGAPFHEEGGAVYIFHGSNMADFDKKPSQIILGRTLGSNPLSKSLKTFGWSLSGGIDVDGNDYPDLLVGAVASDTAVLLRSRPIISVETTLDAGALTSIDKDQSSCPQSWAQACFDLNTIVRVKRTSSSDNINLSRDVFTCRLEVVPFGGPDKAKRVQFDVDRNGKAPTEIEWDCGKGADLADQRKRHRVYVPKKNRDWLNPLEFKFTVELSTKRKPELTSEGDRLPNIDQYPVLDAKGSQSSYSIPFDKKCGHDNSCQSNLVVQCNMRNLPIQDGIYVKQVGVDDTLDLYFQVLNLGERAYDSILYVQYDKAELDTPELRNDLSPGVNIGEYDDNLVTVSLGNPVMANSNLSFTLQFRLVRGKAEAIGRPLEFRALANSTSDETDDSNNNCSSIVRVIKEADMELTGVSLSEHGPNRQVFYRGDVKGESAMEFEEDVGPLITHRYTVTNNGPWGVSNVTVIIDFPFQVQSPYPQGKWALYVMEKPISKMNVPGQGRQIRTCHVDFAVDRINPLGLTENTKYALDKPTDDNFFLFRSKRGGFETDYKSAESEKVIKRRKRELRIQPEDYVEKKTGETFKVVYISCERRSAKCFPITCSFDYMDNGITAEIEVRTRLWQSTFVEDYRDVRYVRIVSNGRIELDPKQGVQEDTRNNYAKAVTTAYPDLPKITGPAEVPIWVYIVAVFVGIFLLFLIVIICWRCGFFKRRKRTDHQPLYKAEVHTAEEWQQLN